MRNFTSMALIAGLALGLGISTSALTVTTTGSDGFGASSFNSAGVWDNGLAPSAGNDYVIDTGHRVRTPADAGSYTFAGDSLTIQDAGAAADLLGLAYKGTGNTGVITVDNLILANGTINHISGAGDLFQLDGNITVTANSLIYAKQGAIDLLAALHGSATITNPGSDGAGRVLNILSSANTFTGNIVNGGRTVLADNAIMNFVIGGNGVNNSVTGTGDQMDFNGDFVLDLSGASANVGDTWVLASAANQTFGETFSVVGFTESNDVWTSGNYQFSEANGTLTYIPEPSSLALLGLGGLLIARRRR